MKNWSSRPSPVRCAWRLTSRSLLCGLVLWGAEWTAAGDRDSAPVAPASVEAPPEFVSHLQGLLDLGLNPDSKSAGQAETHYREALRMRPHDPRLEFAYALVLNRLFRSVEAHEHLEAAAADLADYFPARQTLIRHLILQRHYQAAAERISEVARSLRAEDPEASEQAEWMGRIVATVAGPVGTDDAHWQFAYMDVHLRQELPAVLHAAYARGFDQLQREVEELEGSLDVVATDATTQSVQTQTEIDANLAKKLTALKSQQADARQTRKKWDDWITDELRKSDGTLKELEKKYSDVENSITAQNSSITSLRLQLDRIDRGLAPNTGAFNSVTSSSSDRRAVETQLLFEEQRLLNSYAAQEELSRRAGAQISQQQSAVAAYQEATGLVRNELNSLTAWNKRIKAVADRAKKQAEKRPGSVTSLESRLHNLNTFDPVDFGVERERLLAEYGISAPAAVE